VNRDFKSQLLELGACPTALQWVCEQGDAELVHYWNACPNGEWIVWLFSRLVEKMVVDKSVLLKALVACAHLRVPQIGDLKLREEVLSVLNGVMGHFDASVSLLALRDRVYALNQDLGRCTDEDDRWRFWGNAIGGIGRRTYTQTRSGFSADTHMIYHDLLYTGVGASIEEQERFLGTLRQGIPWATAKAAWQQYTADLERGET